MAITKINLQPITTESDYSNITIGNSKFTDDIWDLSELISGKTLLQRFKEVDFAYIKNRSMKEVIKLYAYYKLSECKPQSLRNMINSSLPNFIKYCDDKNISNFEEITKNVFCEYAMWLKEEKRYQQLLDIQVVELLKKL